MRKTVWLIIAGTFLFNSMLAQNEIEMADRMRSDGKIYVVVAVACIVFAVITAYIITVDRKIRKIEKKSK